jgi:Flp pilus assembly protein TadG
MRFGLDMRSWKNAGGLDMRRLKSLVCDEYATELVEFAIASSILFTLIFGIIEFCMAMYAGNFVAFAAQQGARYAMVLGDSWTNPCVSAGSYDCQLTVAPNNYGGATGVVTNYILGLPHPGLNNLTASNITVALTTTASGGACTVFTRGCRVKVTVSYTFRMNLPFYSPSFPLTSTSIETIQD